jgi:hypothetical protein
MEEIDYKGTTWPENKVNVHLSGLCGSGLHSNCTEQFGRSDSIEPDLKLNQEGC